MNSRIGLASPAPPEFGEESNEDINIPVRLGGHCKCFKLCEVGDNSG